MNGLYSITVHEFLEYLLDFEPDQITQARESFVMDLLKEMVYTDPKSNYTPRNEWRLPR